jgi:hypothetical protein
VNPTGSTLHQNSFGILRSDLSEKPAYTALKDYLAVLYASDTPTPTGGTVSSPTPTPTATAPSATPTATPAASTAPTASPKGKGKKTGQQASSPAVQTLVAADATRSWPLTTLGVMMAVIGLVGLGVLVHRFLIP